MKPTPTESASMSRRQFVAASAVAAGGGVAALLTRDATASAGAGVAADMTPVSVEDVIESRRGDYGIVVLTDGDGRYLPIWVGHCEAQAIRLGLKGIATARPMTYDFAQALIEATDATPTRVVITQLREMTYFAQFVVTLKGEERAVDSRPSDAIALAVRAGVPILVAASVMDLASVREGEIEQLEPPKRA
jgi:bifunctional DNase/RNase